MKRTAALVLTIAGLLAAQGLLAFATPATAAATITVDTTVTAEVADAACGLAEAIIASNTDAAYMGCPAGSGADTIVLQSAPYILLTGPYTNPNTLGPNGLPAVTGVLTIEGNGAIIARSTIGGTPQFRIMESTNTADLTLRNLTVSNGDLSSDDQWAGGGVLNCGVLELAGVTVSDNRSGDDGGGIGDNNCNSLDSIDITIRDSAILRNTAGEFGGAMTAYHSGPVVISGSTFAENTALGGEGGAIVLSGPTTISETVFRANQVPFGAFRSAGGALSIDGGQVTIARTTFDTNSARTGGAIDMCCGGTTLGVEDSTFSGNHAADGGAIFSNFAGGVALTRTTLEGNRADGTGGAIRVWRTTVDATNSTFTGNTAATGGAVYSRSTPGFGAPTLLNMVNVTMSGNGATVAGGNLYNEGTGAPDLHNVFNSIVANPTSGANCVGAVVDVGHNLTWPASDTSCAGFTVADPQLGPLAPNGGPTETMALLPGSPALDAVPSDDSTPTDQRGVPRPQGTDSDIGAYEKIVPSLSIGDVTLAEGDAGPQSFTFTITRSGITSETSSVDWSTADGSAVAPSDYTAVSPTTVNFAAGETTKTLSVAVNGDTSVEANDGFTVNLSNPVGAVITDGTGVGRITNDDAAAFSVDDVTVAEGDSGTSLATFTVSRSGDVGDAASVQWRTLDVHATANGDYLAVPLTTLSFGAGETTKQVTVTVNGDTIFEPTEDFYVRLSNPTGLHSLADATGLGTITNDDAALSIGDATVAEGNAGTSLATFIVTRAGDTSDAASVQWFTLPGTATAGEDFATVALTTLSFAPGETSKAVSVTINGDTAVEANETFVVRLGSAGNASIADNSGLGRITNDDNAAFSVSDATVTEGNAGTTTATFTVSRAGAAGGTATVQWSTADGTATAASGDYVAVAPTSLTFGPGETTKAITVTVNGDTAKEANESFQVRLASPTGAALADSSGLGRITNDD